MGSESRRSRRSRRFEVDLLSFPGIRARPPRPKTTVSARSSGRSCRLWGWNRRTPSGWEELSPRRASGVAGDGEGRRGEGMGGMRWKAWRGVWESHCTMPSTVMHPARQHHAGCVCGPRFALMLRTFHGDVQRHSEALGDALGSELVQTQKRHRSTLEGLPLVRSIPFHSIRPQPGRRRSDTEPRSRGVSMDWFGPPKVTQRPVARRARPHEPVSMPRAVCAPAATHRGASDAVGPALDRRNRPGLWCRRRGGRLSDVCWADGAAAWAVLG